MKKTLSFKEYSFSYLIENSKELRDLRKEYEATSADKRQRAADDMYHSSIAADIFNAMGMANEKQKPWPDELYALAIDPDYAPAIATVGSFEYIYGRHGEAMDHFFSLIALPPDTEDLAVIIDKAGDFLVDNDDFENAMTLYSAAVEKHPNVAIFRCGLSYCLGKSGRHDESVDQARKAVELEPENHIYLTDLGWCLTEAGNYADAHCILEKAVAISPPDYELAKGNLAELQRRMKLKTP